MYLHQIAYTASFGGNAAKAVSPRALVVSLATPMCGKLTRAGLVLAYGYWQDPDMLDIPNQ